MGLIPIAGQIADALEAAPAATRASGCASGPRSRRQPWPHPAEHPDPAPSAGESGQLLLDPDASITALLHEVQHARDAAALGFPGMRRLFDPDARWALNQDACDAEIRFLQKLDHSGTAPIIEQLLANRELERLAISGE